MMSRHDARAAYIAGVIDCDGHICWRGGKYSAPNVGVTSISDNLLSWLRTNLGGSCSLQRSTCHGYCDKMHVHKRSNIYKWHVTGFRAVTLLHNIRPFLIIKGDKSDIVTSMYFDHLVTMVRAARRVHHIRRERMDMRSLGWSDAPIPPFVTEKWPSLLGVLDNPRRTIHRSNHD